MSIQSVADLRREFLGKPLDLHIGGRWVPSCSGARFDIVDPSSGEPFATVADGGAADIDLAVQAARAAFENGPWRSMPPSERARLLWKLADAVERDGDHLALIETLNTGKPLRVARAFDVHLAVESIRYNSGWATKLGGVTHPMSQAGEWHAFTVREPVGVAGQIVTFNVPLTMAANKMSAALAAGCTVVLKPAEQTPLTAIRLGQLAEMVGFPPGVINIVFGRGKETGVALVEHPDVDKVSFTGSTAVGKAVLAAAGGNLKRVTLELGGKSPVVILPDADIERAMDAATMGVFGNSGQVCAAGSRLLVHGSIYDRVVEGIARRAGMLKVRPGLDPECDIGPVISSAQVQRVLGYIDGARRDGAELVCGGRRPDRPGYFIEPAVLAGTRPDMAVVREEIFGPVACVMPFDDCDPDAIARLANDSVFGLSASIWTRDIGLAHRLARRIKAGSVKVNASAALDFGLPFGGQKQSGWGRENGREGVEEYTELKSVAVCL
ncbi:aldehyde dehydrogenase family protein [Magnetospirillum sp. 15-1]|uniref:aldehyde dehydrogenase family protein n=1 Tax=Magnetospirillum sp. 15-1 TaxID=1979370 RepID=UPI0018D54349|nr:aldehyde dehydrogenase family protein [Magnetospirillum sp. 15-1]